MVETLTDKELVQEMRILWKQPDLKQRRVFGKLIRDFFDEGDRSEKIINTLQEKI